MELAERQLTSWIARSETRGAQGLLDMDRRPLRSPLRLSAEMTLEVIRVRQMHPTCGPRKLADVLAYEHPGATLPSARTIARILIRAAMVVQRSRRRRWKGSSQAPRVQAAQPNDLWTVDFKGWWQTRDGQHCEPLTVRDAVSGFVLCVQIHAGTSTDPVRRDFERLFRIYGLPRAIPEAATLRCIPTHSFELGSPGDRWFWRANALDRRAH